MHHGVCMNTKLSEIERKETDFCIYWQFVSNGVVFLFLIHRYIWIFSPSLYDAFELSTDKRRRLMTAMKCTYMCMAYKGRYTVKVGRIHERERFCCIILWVCVYSLLIQTHNNSNYKKKVRCDIIRIDGSFAFAFFSSFLFSSVYTYISLIFYSTFFRQTACTVQENFFFLLV